MFIYFCVYMSVHERERGMWVCLSVCLSVCVSVWGLCPHIPEDVKAQFLGIISPFLPWIHHP